jgi:vacuolar-type H+-ATPase subunit H
MYGLEKKPGDKFAFDLEKEIKESPARAKEIFAKVEKRVQEVKKFLREGQNEKEFEKFGVLLHGYAALQKVLRKAAK